MHTARMMRRSRFLLWILLAGAVGLDAVGIGVAQDKSSPRRPNIPGDWVEMPKDGRPWKHPATDLQFPPQLGDFILSAGFIAKNPTDGVALTYTLPKTDLKADIVIFPCGVDLRQVKDIRGVTHSQVEFLANDLIAMSNTRGYTQKQRSAVTDQPVPLWGQGLIPMSSITLDMVPSDATKEALLPSINQWLSLLIYQDHFVQISVVMPSAMVGQLRKRADELITLVLHCIRFPALVPEMVKLCVRYTQQPLSEDGRRAADSLLALSKESPVFEVILPGEALTATLDQINLRSHQSALDLVRGFVVGSSAITLRNGDADQSLEEGARVMLETWRLLKAKNEPVASAFLDDLAAAQEKKQAAVFLKEKMRSAVKP